MFSTWISIPSVNIAARVSHIHFKSTSTTHDRPWACHQATRGGFCTTRELDVLSVRATVLLASAKCDVFAEGSRAGERSRRRYRYLPLPTGSFLIALGRVSRTLQPQSPASPTESD